MSLSIRRSTTLSAGLNGLNVRMAVSGQRGLNVEEMAENTKTGLRKAEMMGVGMVVESWDLAQSALLLVIAWRPLRSSQLWNEVASDLELRPDRFSSAPVMKCPPSDLTW